MLILLPLLLTVIYKLNLKPFVHSREKIFSSVKWVSLSMDIENCNQGDTKHRFFLIVSDHQTIR